MPARPSALARRRARYPTLGVSPVQDATPERLAEELLGLTICDNEREMTQPNRLWTSRQQFQEALPLLERAEGASINTAIVETFHSVTTIDDAPSSNPGLSFTAATPGQLAISSEYSPLDKRTLPPSPSGQRAKQRSPTSTTVEDSPEDNRTQSSTGYAPPPCPSVPMQPPLSIRYPVQPQDIPQRSTMGDIPDGTQLPRRFPRRTAAEKGLQDDLKMAAGIGSDLNDLEKVAAMEPTLELYYHLRERLDEVKKSIGLLRCRDPRIQQSRDHLHNRHGVLCKTLTTWSEVIDLPDTPRDVNTSKLRHCSLPAQYLTNTPGHHFKVPIDGYGELAQVSFLLVFICQVVMGTSRRDGDFLAGMITILLSLVCDRVDPASAPSLKHTLKVLPATMEAIASKFAMDAKVIVRAVCVQCHANYDPSDGPIPYPSTCTNYSSPESQCNASLFDEFGKPLKTCSTYPFEEYIGSLFSDPVIEGYLTKNKVHGPPPSNIRTPHDAKFLRSFQGQDGKLFCVSPDGEARLTFTLFVDFFATEGMKERGPHTSLGIVALACLDLPIEIRYKPEYMYLVCIIPGPNEPTLTQLNHYIDPVVTIMLESWLKGIKLSRTALRGELGLLVRCAIALVVCDLPAAWKTSQLLASTSKIFCSVCDCWDVRDAGGSIVKDWHKLRGRHDCDQWHIRDVARMRSAAEQWRDAATSSVQRDIVAAHGVRWSPLWRLPYWNPCRQLVVDSMHCLLEGLVKFHCLQVLRLTEMAANNVPSRPPAFSWPFAIPSLTDEANNESQQWSENDVKDIQKIHTALTAEICNENDVAVNPEVRSRTQLEQYLTKRAYRPLAFVLADVGALSTPGGRGGKVRKADMAKALAEWVSILETIQKHVTYLI